MAKVFNHSEIADLAQNGYKPRIKEGVVVCDVEPPAEFVPQAKDSVTQALDRKQNIPEPGGP